jgi:hypothetical protein
MPSMATRPTLVESATAISEKVRLELGWLEYIRFK